MRDTAEVQAWDEKLMVLDAGAYLHLLGCYLNRLPKFLHRDSAIQVELHNPGLPQLSQEAAL
jgi:hypothetical protein